MTTFQRVMRLLAIVLAIFLIVAILGGVFGVVGLLSGLSSEDTVTEDIKTYSVGASIHELDIEINAADLCIKEGEAFSVESNLKQLKVDDTGGRLKIKELTKNKLFVGAPYKDAVLTIYIPAGTVFDKVSITTGAARLTVDALTAETVELELGAGEVYISSLVATRSADIEGGAGRITIAHGELTELDMDMGAGRLELTTALTGECTLNMGVGSSNITLLGGRDAYKLDLEKGIGSISVDGENVFDFDSSGNGTNKVVIKGGIGAINVRFE